MAAKYPALAPHIVVTGDLRVEVMLAMQDQRARIRRELGFADDDIVVLTMSTWGPACMMQTIGPELFDEAAKVMRTSRYRFIISSHPNLWESHHRDQRLWDDFLRGQRQRGFTVIEPTDRWERYLVAADVAISDYTSLSLTYSILGKPIAFVPIRQGIYAPEAPGAKLHAMSPKLQSPGQLVEVIEHCLAHYPLDRLRELQKQVYSYPGQARQRMRTEIYDLLNLPPPNHCQ